jgi:hypothetical protein
MNEEALAHRGLMRKKENKKEMAKIKTTIMPRAC